MNIKRIILLIKCRENDIIVIGGYDENLWRRNK